MLDSWRALMQIKDKLKR